MSASKFPAFVVLTLTAILMTPVVSAVSGQAAAPSATTAPDSTRASEPTPKPRPPTHKDVVELGAAMHLPGWVLDFVAIVGNYALAGATFSDSGRVALATNTSGKWVQIADDPGSFGADEIVDLAPDISLPTAAALVTQAQREEVYWSGGVPSAEFFNPPAEFDNKVKAYGDYCNEGHEAAGRGDFDAAIAAWTKAAAIDFGDLRICGDARQRLDIRAAKDAKARMNEHHLTKEQAASWFERHDHELWKAKKGCKFAIDSGSSGE